MTMTYISRLRPSQTVTSPGSLPRWAFEGRERRHGEKDRAIHRDDGELWAWFALLDISRSFDRGRGNPSRRDRRARGTTQKALLSKFV